jgi:hypothetical protein
MSVRDTVKSLEFFDAEERTSGLFGEVDDGVTAGFRLELAGKGVFEGFAERSPTEPGGVSWETTPPGDVEVLERFVLLAFYRSVRTEMVVDPVVDLDAVARDYESEYGEEEEEE